MSPTPQTRTEPSRSRTLTRTATVAATVAVALALWALATQALGVEVRSPEMGGEPPADITAGHVAIASLVASAVAWGLLAALERFTEHARRIWLILTLIGLVASFTPPLTGDGITTANQVVLVLLHLAVAAVVVPGLLRTSPVDGTPAPATETKGAGR